MIKEILKLPYAGKEENIKASGHKVGKKIAISIGFQPKLFMKINRMAKANSFSFGEQVRRLCEIATKEI